MLEFEDSVIDTALEANSSFWTAAIITGEMANSDSLPDTLDEAVRGLKRIWNTTDATRITEALSIELWVRVSWGAGSLSVGPVEKIRLPVENRGHDIATPRDLRKPFADLRGIEYYG